MKKLCLATFAALMLLIPATASAATLCVNQPAADCTTEYTSVQLQQALTAAQGNSQDNVLRIGAGTYTGPFTYAGNNHALSIDGAGEGATSIVVPNNAAAQTALQVLGPATTIQDLDIQLSATNSDGDVGLDTTLTAVRRVHVIGNGSDNTTAIRQLGGSLTDADVDQAISTPSGNLAVFAGGNLSITNSTFTGETGINFSAPNATLNASRVIVNANARGIETDGGTINLDDSLIDLGNHDGVGLYAENGNASPNAKTINANHVTIVGTGSNSIGVRARSMVANAKQTSTITLNNSIISGMNTSIQRAADNNGAQGGASVANVTTTYSNYDPAKIDDSNGPNGSGSIAATNQTNLASGFVDGAGGDYRLAPSSLLIDAGDPAIGGPTHDLAGNDRVIDGNDDYVARRDIGAYERVDTVAPPVQITSGPSGTTTNPAVEFQFTSPDPTASFECRFDADGFAPCTTPGSHSATVSAGAHTFAVRATDHYANASTATQSFTVDIPAVPTDTPPSDDPPGNHPSGDTKAPKTSIDGATKLKTTKKHVRLSFGADENATFECSLDKAAFAPCSSPYKTPKLKPGKHTVTIRATDTAGNVESSPASVKIKVKRKPKS